MTACERIRHARVENELSEDTSDEVDFQVEDHGSVWLLRTFTGAAEDWVEEYVQGDQMFGDALVVEARYIGAICEGLGYAGFVGRIGR